MCTCDARQGALVGLLGRRTKVAVIAAVGAASSMYVAWDMYAATGRDPSGFSEYVRCVKWLYPTLPSSAGCFDWLLGRNEAGFSFVRCARVQCSFAHDSLADDNSTTADVEC